MDTLTAYHTKRIAKLLGDAVEARDMLRRMPLGEKKSMFRRSVVTTIKRYDAALKAFSSVVSFVDLSAALGDDLAQRKVVRKRLMALKRERREALSGSTETETATAAA